MVDKITILGIEFYQDKKWDDWWESDEAIFIPYFEQKLEIILPSIKGEEITNEYTKVLGNFLKLDSKDRLKASDEVYTNYKKFIEYVGEDEFEIKTPEEIWKYVDPGKIYLTKEDDILYIQITAGCDWEIEHGLQLIYKYGKELTRVSQQDGYLTE